jgi:hypothetical protein
LLVAVPNAIWLSLLIAVFSWLETLSSGVGVVYDSQTLVCWAFAVCFNDEDRNGPAGIITRKGHPSG